MYVIYRFVYICKFIFYRFTIYLYKITYIFVKFGNFWVAILIKFGNFWVVILKKFGNFWVAILIKFGNFWVAILIKFGNFWVAILIKFVNFWVVILRKRQFLSFNSSKSREFWFTIRTKVGNFNLQFEQKSEIFFFLPPLWRHSIFLEYLWCRWFDSGFFLFLCLSPSSSRLSSIVWNTDVSILVLFKHRAPISIPNTRALPSRACTQESRSTRTVNLSRR